MRIAMVCPLDRAVSPSADGAPHRAIGELAAALVADDHQVTLFAVEGSCGGSELVTCPAPEGDDRELAARFSEAVQLARVLETVGKFDLVHNHAGAAAAAFLSRADLPLLTTIHHPCTPDERAAFTRLGDNACIAASSPGLVPEGLPLLGTMSTGPGMAESCLALYNQVLDRRENYRPWGHYIVLEDHPEHKVKRIVVDPGQRLSLQLHHRRAEHWLMIEGEGLVTLNDEEILVRAGEAIDIPQEARHRVCNPGDGPCVFIEVQTGDYFGEDDIVRLEDDYGRNG